MDTRNFTHFKEILLGIEKEILSQKDECTITEKLPDVMDAAIEENTKQFAMHVNIRKSAYLKKIRNALSKIDNGTYGECEECSDVIPTKRLIARPTAMLCLDCKLEQEKFEKKEKDKLRGGILEDFDDSI